MEYNNDQKQYVEKHRKAVIKKHLGNTFSDDYLDMLSVVGAEFISTVKQEELDSIPLTVGLARADARKIEMIMYTMQEEFKRLHMPLIWDKHDVRYKLFKELLLEKYAHDELWVDNHCDIVRKTKALIIKTSKNLILDESEIIANLYYINDILWDSDKEEYRYMVIGYLAVILALLYCKKRKLPLAKGLKLSVDYEYESLGIEKYKVVFRQWDSDMLDKAIDENKLNHCIFAWAYLALLNVIRTHFRSEYYSLLNVKIRFKREKESYSCDYVSKIEELMGELVERRSVLPMSGVVVNVDSNYSMQDRADKVSSLDRAFIDGVKDVFINEVITINDGLLVLFRIVNKDSYCDIIIFDPVSSSVKFSSISLHKHEDKIIDGYPFYTCLRLYKAALNICGDADNVFKEQIETGIKLSTNTVLYDERVFVPHHTRRLPEGEHASQEALQAAAKIGLKVGEGRTYVRPFYKEVGIKTFSRTEGKNKPIDITKEIVNKIDIL